MQEQVNPTQVKQTTKQSTLTTDEKKTLKRRRLNHTQKKEGFSPKNGAARHPLVCTTTNGTIVQVTSLYEPEQYILDGGIILVETSMLIVVLVLKIMSKQ